MYLPPVIINFLERGQEDNDAIRDLVQQCQASNHKDSLMQSIYNDLSMSARQILSEKRPSTVQASNFGNHLFLQLEEANRMVMELAGCEYFLATCARSMRRFFMPQRDKGLLDPAQYNLLAPLFYLDQLFDELEKISVRQSRLIDLWFFLGFSPNEAAKTLQIPRNTAHKELNLARAWLFTCLTFRKKKY